MCKYAPKSNITVKVPMHFCMELGGDQCQFLYSTMSMYRCRAFDLEGKFLYRDKDLRTHKCQKCMDSRVEK